MRIELVYILIAFFVCIFLGWLYSRLAKDKERRLLIEKGINPDDYLKSERDRNPNDTLWSKVGIVVIGIGVGFTVIGILHQFEVPETFIIAAMWLCIGFSFLVANFIGKGKSDRN